MPLRFRRPRPGVNQAQNPNADIDQTTPEVPATVTVLDVQAAASDGPEQLLDRTHGGASKEPNEKKQVNWIRTGKESRCLQSLFTSDYKASKARNPDRVPGTCQWFLQSEKYKKWQENQSSDLLWVTADPGCGKSVLSKSLIDQELQNISSSTTCYFFFKDDSAGQRSVVKAICALLHQYLCARMSPILLQKATAVFRAHGTGMMESFHILWKLLLDIAQDPAAGQILCVLDALDECDEDGRENLISCLNVFPSTSAGRSGQLKLLVTSRPYNNIEESFDHLTIRLAGEDESEAIQREIDLVIQDRVPRVGKRLRLDSVTQNILQQRLLDTKNRTYLWLHLILEDIVKRSLKVRTPQRMEKFLELLPTTVYDAYERMLEQSLDHNDARRLLQIVLAATRPLNLEEINIALHIQEDSKSIVEVDLIPEESLPTYVKNLCGLFVTIYDSKVYLLRQTAREFLLSQDSCHGTPSTASQHRRVWMHSFQLETCHYAIARVCLTYMLFDVFEDEPLLLYEDEKNKGDGGDGGDGDDDDDEGYDECDDWDIKYKSKFMKRIARYNQQHALFMYTSIFWAFHFEMCKTNDGLSEKWLGICDTRSQRFRTWFQYYWDRKGLVLGLDSTHHDTVFPQLKEVMVASFLGHDAMLELLCEQQDINTKDVRSRTPLWWAVRRRYSTVKLLLDRGAIQSGDECGATPLIVAACLDFDESVAPLVDAGASLECHSYHLTPLEYAVHYGHLKSVKALISKGANPKIGLLLWIACYRGHLQIARLLLAHEAPVDGEMEIDLSPLRSAAERGYEDIANLLIDADATLELRDANGRTPLASAALRGHWGITELLLKKGVNIDTKDKDGRTPLSLAAGGGQFEVVAVLLDAHATIDTRDNLGKTPLMLATQAKSEKVMRLLLQNDAEINLTDRKGRAALCYAAHGIHDTIKTLSRESQKISLTDLRTIEEFVEILSDTPLESAARSGHTALVNYLLMLQYKPEPLPVAKRELERLAGRVATSYGASLCLSIMNQQETMRMLIEHGADAKIEDCEGCKSLCSELDNDDAQCRTLKCHPETLSAILDSASRSIRTPETFRPFQDSRTAEPRWVVIPHLAQSHAVT